MTRPAAPPRGRYYRVDDAGRIAEEAAELGLSAGAYVLHALARYRWLRDAHARGARVLVEDDAGLLKEIRYPGSLR